MWLRFSALNRVMAGMAVCLLMLFMYACSGGGGSNASTVIRITGQEGTAAGQFVFPESIVQDTAGNIYIADTYNDRIQKFDASGAYLLSWGSSGTGDGQFMGCRGLAIDSANNVYVTDVVLHRVQKFNSAGNFITKWGSEGTGAGQFSAPFDISADSLNNIYVVDSGNNRVQKFDASGRYAGQFGTAGTADGRFEEPIGIAIDRSDNIYIADAGNNRVQKFDRSMRFVVAWGERGTGDGQFIGPYGLTADDAGCVYVTDIGNNRVQKFDASGNYLGKAGQTGYREGQLYDPADVVVERSGSLYVVDSMNHRIQLLAQAVFTAPSVPAAQGVASIRAPIDFQPAASWMRAIAGTIGTKPLSTVVIPGTHDTGTYGITTDSAMANDGNFDGPALVTDTTGKVTGWCHRTWWTPHALCELLDDAATPINNAGTAVTKSVQAPWSKSQNESVLEQLNGGIRFLDLRVQADNNHFLVVHSMVSVPLDYILDDIATFCKNSESSQEIILVALKTYQMAGHDEDLVDLIQRKLVDAAGQSLLIPNAADASAVSLNSLWTTHGRVMVFYPDRTTVDNHHDLWLKNSGDGNAPDAGSTLVNPWPNTKESLFLLNLIGSNRSYFLASYPDTYSKYFYVTQLVRTQDGVAIAIGIESEVFSLFSNRLNYVERHLFKKGWKALHLHMPPIIGPTNLLDWGNETNEDVLEMFFQGATNPTHSYYNLKWNILMVDNYKRAPVDFVQRIISYNQSR